MQKLDISSKEEYLKWVVSWKIEYRDISRDIRNLRLAKNEAKKKKDIPAMAKAIGRKMYLRTVANSLMYWRMEGKRLSWLARCEGKAYEEDATRVAA